MKPIKDYAEEHGLEHRTVWARIQRGELKAFKWGVQWVVLEDYEDVPPARISLPRWDKPKRTTIETLERRIEELEWAVKELQCIIAARGYKMTKAIVGRLPNEQRERDNGIHPSRYLRREKWTRGPKLDIPKDLSRMVAEE